MTNYSATSSRRGMPLRAIKARCGCGAEPIPDADRLLYRIDMAMGLIAQKTQAQMPVENVQHWDSRDHERLRKILSFVQAAVDLE